MVNISVIYGAKNNFSEFAKYDLLFRKFILLRDLISCLDIDIVNKIGDILWDDYNEQFQSAFIETHCDANYEYNGILIKNIDISPNCPTFNLNYFTEDISEHIPEHITNCVNKVLYKPTLHYITFFDVVWYILHGCYIELDKSKLNDYNKLFKIDDIMDYSEDLILDYSSKTKKFFYGTCVVDFETSFETTVSKINNKTIMCAYPCSGTCSYEIQHGVCICNSECYVKKEMKIINWINSIIDEYKLPIRISSHPMFILTKS